MSLAKKMHTVMAMSETPVTLSELNQLFNDVPKTTIRGRIYDNLGTLFKKVDKGVYVAINPKTNRKALIVQGDGRKLDEIPNDYIDAIITDHPWEDEKSNKGGNRHFDGSYAESSFKYTSEDFKEKYRVLKDGGFLVENLPEENANNFEYLYQIKKMAIAEGFEYFAQVPWRKGTQVNNTGRKSKAIEMLLFMTKGKPRNLRYDKQRSLKSGKDEVMSGTRNMLPIEFNFQPPSKNDKKHKAEKPVELLEAIIDNITNPGEIVLDQFAGSLNVVLAALNTDRNCISYELNKEFVENNIKSIEAKYEVIKEDEED